MRGLRVLVVEDDPKVAALLVQMLLQMGFEVCPIIAASEAEVVTQVVCLSPELLIVDARLAGGRGISAVVEILRNQSMPYVFVSSDSYGAYALRPGAVVLQEPFRQSDLARAIHRALGFTAVFSGAKRPQATHAINGR